MSKAFVFFLDLCVNNQSLMLMNSNYLTSAMNILRSKVARMSMFLASVMSLLLISACSSGGNEVEIYQSDRSNIVDVKPLIKAIDTDDALLSGNITPYSFDKYLVIQDGRPVDKILYVFDNSNFKLLGATGKMGQGPGEVLSSGSVLWNGGKREMYMPDYGSFKIYGYSMDSVLVNPNYMPFEKSRMHTDMYPSDIIYVNDTLSYCRVIKPTSFHTFDQYTGKWNLLTGDVETFQYRYPNLEKYRYSVAMSSEQDIIVEANSMYDLITILDLDGNLKHNIHGPNWEARADGNDHFTNVAIYGKYIIAPYDGESSKWQSTVCHVFDTDGNYVKTLNVGYVISGLCVDNEYHRLIFCFNDDIQLGYLDLDEVLD